MKEATIIAPAKINLTLDVKDKRPDGYHNIESIMHQIDLCDTVVLKEIPQGIRVRSTNPGLPGDSSNLAYRAAEMLMGKYGIKKGVSIFLAKNIPLGAGLAGGSTDAAAVLKGLCQIFDLNVEQRELMLLGERIGSDVPFCLLGGTAIAEGKGEVLTPVINRANLHFVLVNPGFAVSTAQIYELLDREMITCRPDMVKAVRALQDNDPAAVGAGLSNVMEFATFKLFPELQEIKAEMLEGRAIGALMSGSGPTIFAVYENLEQAGEEYDKIKRKYPLAFLCSSYTSKN